MQKIIWGLAIVALVLWSLLVWGMHVLLINSSEFLAPLAASTEFLSQWQAWISAVFAGVERFSGAAAWLIWGLGTFVILAVSAVGSLLTRWAKGRDGTHLLNRARNVFVYAK